MSHIFALPPRRSTAAHSFGPPPQRSAPRIGLQAERVLDEGRLAVESHDDTG